MKRNLTILVFVGMPGSGVSAAVEYCKTQNIPTVTLAEVLRHARCDDCTNGQCRFEALQQNGETSLINDAIDQIERLTNAGQHTIAVDDLYSWEEYKALRHAYPGAVTVIALTASQKIRHHRLAQRTTYSLTPHEASQRDDYEIEHLHRGGPIAMAHIVIHNESSLEALHAQLHDIIHDIDQ